MQSSNNVHQLHILEAFPGDEGEYKCVVTNPAGAISTSAFLKVERKFYKLFKTCLKLVIIPTEFGHLGEFKTKLSDREAAKGESVTFEVEITGEPLPEIQWVKDGKVLVASEEFHVSFFYFFYTGNF